MLCSTYARITWIKVKNPESNQSISDDEPRWKFVKHNELTCVDSVVATDGTLRLIKSGAELSGRSFARSWLERGLQRGDLSFLRDFAFFRNRYPPSIVVDRLCDHALMATTAGGRKRMTLKGWITIFLRNLARRPNRNSN
jgi:hypothetical protein